MTRRVDEVVHQQVDAHARRAAEDRGEPQRECVRCVQHRALGVDLGAAVQRDRLERRFLGAEHLSRACAVAAVGVREHDELRRAPQSQQQEHRVEVHGPGQQRVAVAGGSADHRREGQHCVRVSQDSTHQSLVSDVAAHELEARVRAEVEQRRHAVGQVVEHGDAMARGEQHLAEHAPQVARTTRHQNPHGGDHSPARFGPAASPGGRRDMPEKPGDEPQELDRLERPARASTPVASSTRPAQTRLRPSPWRVKKGAARSVVARWPLMFVRGLAPFAWALLLACRQVPTAPPPETQVPQPSSPAASPSLAPSPPVSPPPPRRAILIGDSITAGSVGGFVGSPFASVLLTLLPQHWTVVNGACGGTTAKDWSTGGATSSASAPSSYRVRSAESAKVACSRPNSASSRRRVGPTGVE